jgi:uncharacterized protein (UPF0371 family)
VIARCLFGLCERGANEQDWFFDNEKYLDEQTAAILDRVNRFDKLYLEFAGKLLFDYHAARVLPGYD